MRLRSQFLIAIAVFGLFTAFTASSIFSIDLTLVNLHSQGEIASDIESAAKELGYVYANYLLYQGNLSIWQANVLLLYTDLCALNDTYPQSQTLADRMMTELTTVNATFNAYVAASPENNVPTEQPPSALNMSILGSQWSEMDGQIQGLISESRQLTLTVDQQISQTYQTNRMLNVSLVALFIAFFLLTYFLVFRRILPPIAMLQKKTKDINHKEPKELKQKSGNNEITELFAEFDEVLGSLITATASKQQLEKEVSERKKAEEALREAQTQLKEHADNLEKMVAERTRKIRESEQSYRELYESFGEGFIATDWELNVIHWNKAAERVTTVEAKDALGKKIYEVLPEMQSVDVTPYYSALQDRQSARFMMNTKSRETGKDAIFEISTYPSTLGILIIVEDKTEEEQNKRLLAIGQTASMVGHDIRNPLQSIEGDLYLIRMELGSHPECRGLEGVEESLEKIEENVFYINKIVSDLQDYTRPLAPQHIPVNINDLLRAVLSAIQIPKNVEAQLETEEIVFLTDPAYLKRILNNLVNNALQAMPEGGKLTLQAKATANHLQISVADTGMGIPEQARQKLFTPLFTTKSKGQGLGLAVVKRLVNGLNGEITYETEEGAGTRFFIELPLKKGH
ncbi:MAG: ATP-binding protein [Candidatus Bathyarchaeota archaeon]|nr:ATP-binding protein [Candidatus Bathyarchaeota archaeon]